MKKVLALLSENKRAARKVPIFELPEIRNSIHSVTSYDLEIFQNDGLEAPRWFPLKSKESQKIEKEIYELFSQKTNSRLFL